MRKLAYLFAFTVLAISTTAQAQIVDIAGRSASSDELGFGGSLRAPLQWRSGNVELLRAGGNLELWNDWESRRLYFSANTDYGRKAGEDFLFYSTGHLRFREQLSDFLGLETFLQAGHDEFRRQEYRFLAGFGARLTLLDGEVGALYYGSAYMPEWERYRDPAENGAGGFQNAFFTHRWSNYFLGTIQANESLSFSTSVYAQPSLSDFSMTRYSGKVGLAISSGPLTLSTSFSASYDPRIPVGVEKLDTTLTNSIGLTF